MNERIQELSAIAKNLATDEATHLIRVHNRTLSLDEEQEIFTTKFAELIVKECIQVSGPEDSYTDEWFKAKADSVNKIKKYFGVEE